MNMDMSCTWQCSHVLCTKLQARRAAQDAASAKAQEVVQAHCMDLAAAGVRYLSVVRDASMHETLLSSLQACRDAYVLPGSWQPCTLALSNYLHAPLLASFADRVMLQTAARSRL